MKRQPLLIDRYLASPYQPAPFNRRKQEIVRDHMYAAKRFVLDDNATEYVAQLIRDVPEAIAYAQEFALLPFPVMYVEIPNFPLWYKTLTGRDSDLDADQSVGYLYAGPRAYVIAKAITDRNSQWPMLGPVEYRLNQPFTPKEELKVCEQFGISRAQLDAYFWGESYEVVGPELVRAFRENHSMGLMIEDETDPKLLIRFYNGSAADLRNMIAMLLFLNQTSKLRYEQSVGPHRAMIHNKPRTFLSHSIVKIDINPVERIRKHLLGGMGGCWRREHTVRGHFCHDRTAREHDHLHDWTEVDVEHWKCKLCSGSRWWRKSHRRGSRDKGEVHTSYEITASTHHNVQHQHNSERKAA